LNQQIRTDRIIANNKTDNIVRYNEKRTCVLVDVVILAGSNVIQKEAGTILKYKDLTVEIERMCNVKPTVIPVITGATGNIWKLFGEIRGKHTGKT
jgi:hypothetical protein